MNAQQKVLAKRGERIYRERFKAEYEESKLGQFVAIDVDGARAFVAQTPEEALQAGLSAVPGGRFHLVKVGAAGVFRVAYS